MTTDETPKPYCPTCGEVPFLLPNDFCPFCDPKLEVYEVG